MHIISIHACPKQRYLTSMPPSGRTPPGGKLKGRRPENLQMYTIHTSVLMQKSSLQAYSFHVCYVSHHVTDDTTNREFFPNELHTYSSDAMMTSSTRMYIQSTVVSLPCLNSIQACKLDTRYQKTPSCVGIRCQPIKNNAQQSTCMPCVLLKEQIITAPTSIC